MTKTTTKIGSEGHSTTLKLYFMIIPVLRVKLKRRFTLICSNLFLSVKIVNILTLILNKASFILKESRIEKIFYKHGLVIIPVLRIRIRFKQMFFLRFTLLFSNSPSVEK